MKLIRHLPFALLLLLSHPLRAAQQEQKTSNYQEWSKQPSEQLLQKGHGYYDQTMPDSALLCYTIVANRYYEVDKKDSTILQPIISAMNQLGILYSYYYYDYQKASSYLRMAQNLAEQYGMKRSQMDICDNLSHILLMENALTNGNDVDERVFRLSQKAFRIGLELRAWESLTTTTINYARYADNKLWEDSIIHDINKFLSLNVPDTTNGIASTIYFCQAMKYRYEDK